MGQVRDIGWGADFPFGDNIGRELGWWHGQVGEKLNGVVMMTSAFDTYLQHGCTLRYWHGLTDSTGNGIVVKGDGMAGSEAGGVAVIGGGHLVDSFMGGLVGHAGK